MTTPADIREAVTLIWADNTSAARELGISTRSLSRTMSGKFELTDDVRQRLLIAIRDTLGDLDRLERVFALHGS